MNGRYRSRNDNEGLPLDQSRRRPRPSVGSVQREGRVGDADRVAPRPDPRGGSRPPPACRRRRITARDARLCTSVKATTGRCGTKVAAHCERRPPDLGRVAAAGQGVADGPAQLEHRLAVEVDPGEAAAADERRRSTGRGRATCRRRHRSSARPCPCCPRFDAWPGVQGPVHERDLRIAVQQDRGRRRPEVPTGVSTSRVDWTGSLARAACMPSSNLVRPACWRALRQRSS